MIRILIVDDHAVVRRGIVNIISSDENIIVAGEASNYAELMHLFQKIQFDILILDITLPDKSGLDVLIELKSMHPDMKIIMLSMHSDEEIIKRAFKTGCSAYLNKDGVPDELIKAIKIVNDGGKYIGAALALKAGLLKENGQQLLPHEKLSVREFQIFCLIASGSPLTEIGRKLALNVKTVGTYRSRIMDKMKLRNNIELTHYAIKNKLVTSHVSDSAE